MSKRRFLMVTDIDTKLRVAIPIDQIIQIREYEHNKDYLAWIQYYYADNKSTTISTKEFFYDIMTGCHTFKLYGGVMKRIYIEMILALVIFAWTTSNIILTGTIFVSCFPIIISFCIQFVGVLAIAMAPED